MNKEKSKNNYTSYLLCFIFSSLVILGILHFFTDFKINKIMTGGSNIIENSPSPNLKVSNNLNAIPENIKLLISNSLDKF